MTFQRLHAAALLLLAGVVPLALAGCFDDHHLNAASPVADSPSLAGDARGFGKVVVANRGSGTISVLDAASGTSLGDFSLPSGTATPEPMYVSYVARTHAVIVGDRANDRVVEFDADNFSVTRTAPAGAGVFHMWVDGVASGQLWVNNDVDNTSTVIDPVSFDVMATVPMPADLVAMGARPHDVVLDPLGRHAYVTLLAPGPEDYVVQFDTGSFLETARAAVGKDPHVSLTARNQLLYVPCQNSNVVEVLHRGTLEPVTSIAVPGAHGAAMTRSGLVFYTTNLPGGGTNALFAIDTRSNEVIGDPADSPYGVPHNVALSTNGQRLFLTHSGGAADKVTFYDASAGLALLGEATVGLNPFGIAFVP